MATRNNEFFLDASMLPDNVSTVQGHGPQVLLKHLNDTKDDRVLLIISRCLLQCSTTQNFVMYDSLQAQLRLGDPTTNFPIQQQGLRESISEPNISDFNSP